MRAVVYSQTGDPDVLHLVERPVPEPGPGEVRVRVSVSGVNPTDWKARRGGAAGAPVDPAQVPNQDGAGTVDAVGEGVDPSRVGERVWLWEAAWQRDERNRAGVRRPARASGGAAGRRCVVRRRGESRHPGADRAQLPHRLRGRPSSPRAGRAGGANGAGRRRGGSGRPRRDPARALGRGAGDHDRERRREGEARACGWRQHVVNYRPPSAAEEILRIAPDGVDVVVEVAAGVNAALDTAVSGGERHRHALCHGRRQPAWHLGWRPDGAQRSLPVRPRLHGAHRRSRTWPSQTSARRLRTALSRWERAPACRCTDSRSSRAAAAHAAVESGAVGKVLIDVS